MELYESSSKLIRHVDTKFKRYLLSRIEWKSRLIEVKGARGVGKTTLMLQRAKILEMEQKNSTLYISLDDPYFYSKSIIETAEEFYKTGGKHLFIDEVHKYPSKHKGFDWSTEIKNIYDKYPELHVTYTGSSILNIYKGQGDLSRRKVSYTLQGMSFREYLIFGSILNFPQLTLEEILSNHCEITLDIANKVRPIKHYRDYIETGYYPFYKEAPTHYFERLKSIISVVLELDIPAITDISFESTVKMKKLLAVIASSVPFVPNLSNLKSELYITDHRTLLKYINYLEKAGLVNILAKEAHGKQLLRKPDKLYLENTNLLQCFNIAEPSKGTLRETFFMNQFSESSQLTFPAKGDFLVNNEFVIEIGGKNKTAKQLKGIDSAYFALDDIETGYANRIPLWLFGFMY